MMKDALTKLSDALPLFDVHLAEGCKHCRRNNFADCKRGRNLVALAEEAADYLGTLFKLGSRVASSLCVIDEWQVGVDFELTHSKMTLQSPGKVAGKPRHRWEAMNIRKTAFVCTKPGCSAKRIRGPVGDAAWRYTTSSTNLRQRDLPRNLPPCPSP